MGAGRRDSLAEDVIAADGYRGFEQAQTANTKQIYQLIHKEKISQGGQENGWIEELMGTDPGIERR
jgi:hypothetical protein